MDNFKLKTFVDELDRQKSALKKEPSLDDQTSSETFKLILKEDWIASGVRDNLKNLKDFLLFLIKSIQTVKSNLFYERICNYLYSLFTYVFSFSFVYQTSGVFNLVILILREFKLANTDWENHIVQEMIKANADVKSAESLRLINIQQLGKYFVVTSQKSVRENTLMELLRSAACENKRVNIYN